MWGRGLVSLLFAFLVFGCDAELEGLHDYGYVYRIDGEFHLILNNSKDKRVITVYNYKYSVLHNFVSYQCEISSMDIGNRNVYYSCNEGNQGKIISCSVTDYDCIELYRSDTPIGHIVLNQDDSLIQFFTSDLNARQREGPALVYFGKFIDLQTVKVRDTGYKAMILHDVINVYNNYYTYGALRAQKGLHPLTIYKNGEFEIVSDSYPEELNNPMIIIITETFEFYYGGFLFKGNNNYHYRNCVKNRTDESCNVTANESTMADFKGCYFYIPTIDEAGTLISARKIGVC